MTNPFGAAITRILPTPTPAATAAQFAQVYCTVNDLLNDPTPPAGDVTLLLKQILAASRTIQQEIGEFIPVSETRKFTGPEESYRRDGISRLFIPPMLGLTGDIVNDDVTLEDTDFILQPGERHWRNGPYSEIDVAPEASNLGAWSDELNGVEVPARWGLYEETEDSGATLADDLTDSEKSIPVSDGSKVSPGSVLALDYEQVLVTGYGTPSTAITTIDDDIDATQESIPLADGDLVNIGEIVRIGLEQMRILDISGDDAYVQRHWNKSLAATHDRGANVDVYRQFVVVRGVNGTTAAAYDSAVAISRYVVPADVLFLCKEIATLMLNKATTGYAGRSGNAELGTVYYNDAFPRFDLERVRDHYSIKTVR